MSSITSTSTRSNHLLNHSQDYYPSSFSSSLLEEIYRSFDHNHNHDHDHNHDHGQISYKMKKSSISNSTTNSKNSSIKRSSIKDNSNRTYLDKSRESNRFNLEHWMRSATFSDEKFRRNCSSSTSSSDSSSGVGGFSSSDCESLYGFSSKSKKTTKPTSLKFNRTENFPTEFPTKNKKNDGNNLQRRALKLYGDLKKVKQPISPGAKLSSFINSIFNSNGQKKTKTPQSPSISSNGQKLSKSTTTTSNGGEKSSEFLSSRSCLSKTPSCGGKFERRSVRFIDDDEIRVADVAKRERSVEEMTKELLKKYHNNLNELTVNFKSDSNGRKFKNDDAIIIPSFIENNVEEEEEDGNVSCCSSDLFELENLLDIGASGCRYREELPVFETTSLNIRY